MVVENGMQRHGSLQFFHAHDRIRDTIVGIVAGLSTSLRGVDRRLPVVAFAVTPEGAVMVSTRGSVDLVSRGLDLSSAVSEAAAVVGGVGGGHDIAAGATIPRGEEDRFLETLDRLIGAQLGAG